MNPHKDAIENIRRICDNVRQIYEPTAERKPEPDYLKVDRKDPATWTTRQLLWTFVWGDESRHHEQIKDLLEDRGISIQMLDDDIERLLERVLDGAEEYRSAHND